MEQADRAYLSLGIADPSEAPEQSRGRLARVLAAVLPGRLLLRLGRQMTSFGLRIVRARRPSASSLGQGPELLLPQVSEQDDCQHRECSSDDFPSFEERMAAAEAEQRRQRREDVRQAIKEYLEQSAAEVGGVLCVAVPLVTTTRAPDAPTQGEAA